MLLDGKCCFVYIANKIMVCVRSAMSAGQYVCTFQWSFYLRGIKLHNSFSDIKSVSKCEAYQLFLKFLSYFLH